MNLLHTRAHTHGNTLSFLDSNARTSFETSWRPPAPCDFPASLGGFPPLFTALSWLPCPAVRLFDFAPDSKLSKVLFGSSPSSRSPQSLESSRPSATDSVSETRSERGRSGPHRGLGPALWTSGPASSSGHVAPGAEEAESDEAPGSSPAPRKPEHLWEPHCHRPPFLRDRTPACRSTPLSSGPLPPLRKLPRASKPMVLYFISTHSSQGSSILQPGPYRASVRTVQTSAAASHYAWMTPGSPCTPAPWLRARLSPSLP